MGEERREGENRSPEDRLEVRAHSAHIGGEDVAYTSTAGTVVLREETVGEGEREGRFEGHRPKAEVFFVAYTRDGAGDPSARPVTYVFNGGPGSSSVWLHLGAFGPQRVAWRAERAGGPAPPFRLVDNDATCSNRADLVFIDPVGTGYSGRRGR